MSLENVFQMPFTGLDGFVKLATGMGPKGWLSRGQTNAAWDLRPKAGRSEFFQRSNLVTPRNPLFDDDLMRFAEWRRQAVAYTDALPAADLECLAYAQHYGLATRLLDWTTNPLVALFFAVEARPEDDGIVYFHHPGTAPLQPDHDLSEHLIGIRVFKPRPFDQRILAQQGVFTYHPEPENSFPVSTNFTPVQMPGQEVPASPPLEGFSDPFAVVVPAAAKRQIMQQLARIGVTRRDLFPDLEGLSSVLNWEAHETILDLHQLAAQFRSNASPNA